jgi:hypothetical protein
MPDGHPPTRVKVAGKGGPLCAQKWWPNRPVKAEAARALFEGHVGVGVGKRVVCLSVWPEGPGKTISSAPRTGGLPTLPQTRPKFGPGLLQDERVRGIRSYCGSPLGLIFDRS